VAHIDGEAFYEAYVCLLFDACGAAFRLMYAVRSFFFFFRSLADALEAATTSIFLSFWHMNHCIYLRRRVSASGAVALRAEDRFDAILQRRAQAGVKIYILLWREQLKQFACNNFSKEMKEYFMKVCHNAHSLPYCFSTENSCSSPFLSYFCSHRIVASYQYSRYFSFPSHTSFWSLAGCYLFSKCWCVVCVHRLQ
jgi:hypothetical protein